MSIMRKINVYVVRHGQTDMNVAQKWQGSGSDCLLNETGKAQASNLGETIKHKYIRKFYCSPLLRAVQTANIVADKNFTYAPITILKDLRECDFGDFEGKPYDEVEEKYGDEIHDFFWPTKETWGKKFPNGESKKEVFERVIKALNYIVCCHKFDLADVGVVCHAGVINALACGLGLTDVCYDNCSVLHLVFDYDKCEFVHVKD